MKLQRAIARVRTIISTKSTNHVVERIPLEIVDIIFSFLPVPDQICFSLSCRHIFTCLLSALKERKMQLSELLPREKRLVLCPSATKRPWVQFLRQLENKRWKYCSQCWTLHPHLGSTSRLPYCPGCHLLRERICPIPYAGKVDLCPCLAITFRDKLQLMEICKQVQQDVHDGKKYYYNNVLYHPSHGKSQKALFHECSFTDHPLAMVKIKTFFWVEEKTTSLKVGNQYKFEISQGTSSQALSSSLETALACPHWDTKNWIAEFFAEAGSDFFGWNKYRLLSPIFGTWVSEEMSGAGDGPYSFEICASRNLGNREWPNRIWDRNRRL